MFNPFKSKLDKLLPLPLSVPELDAYVAELVKEFDLPNTDDTYENVATMLLHAPPSVCKAPMRFFGESVKKSIVNQAAYTKLEEFRAKRAQKERNEKQKAEIKAIAQANEAATLPVEGAANGQPTSKA